MQRESLISQSELLRVLSETWSRETAATPDHWSSENPAWGHCAITALIIQEFFGGRIVRIDLSSAEDVVLREVRSHYFNELSSGCTWDATESQFVYTSEYRRILPLARREYRTRQELLANDGTRARYQTLRYRLAKTMAGAPRIFDDDIFEICLKQALLSGCSKGKYGCVAVYANGNVHATCNNPIDELRDWCEPECIRWQIPSRQESMVGACMHAEEATLQLANQGRGSVALVGLYVAGFRSNGLAFIKEEAHFTCIRCAMALYVYGATGIHVPVQNQWFFVPTSEAISQARQYAVGAKTLPKQ